MVPTLSLAQFITQVSTVIKLGNKYRITGSDPKYDLLSAVGLHVVLGDGIDAADC